MKSLLLCEICEEIIAGVDLLKLKRPLTSEMFLSPGDGYENPFPAGIEWEWFRCPYCHNQPFVTTEEEIDRFVMGTWPGPEKVKTSQGFYVIGNPRRPGEPAKTLREVFEEEDLAKEWAERAAKVVSVVLVLENREVGIATNSPGFEQAASSVAGKPAFGPRKAVHRTR